jgi:type VI secretion system VasD/TssJ family lipoprotein
LLGAVLTTKGCKKKGPPPCNPDDHVYEMVRVAVQPMPQINVDPEGTPRATTLRIYQLKGGRSLDVPLDFQQVWQDAASAFGDELLKEEELTIYPDKPDVFEIAPEADVTHFVAAAIFREPLGNAWYAEWEAPQFHGDSVCIAKKKKQEYYDPCFLVFMEGSQIDGGHEPPPGMDMEVFTSFELQCPPAPLKVKPKPPAEDGKKKRKKGEGKAKAEDAAGKAGEAQDAGEQAQGAGEAVSDPPVPGK